MFSDVEDAKKKLATPQPSTESDSSLTLTELLLPKQLSAVSSREVEDQTSDAGISAVPFSPITVATVDVYNKNF